MSSISDFLGDDVLGHLAGARVLVAGARVTGVSTARVLVELGAEVTVTDSSADQLHSLAGAPGLTDL
ncbi:MAG: hypothetical protein ACRDSZ_19005, partial [Pseudonocardiaceae bacterium]